MTTTPTHDQRIAQITFSSVYPLYVNKVEKKGRAKEELHAVIQWLTGYDDQALAELIDQKVTFKTFFKNASINPNAYLITGVICDYRIENVTTPVKKKLVTLIN